MTKSQHTPDFSLDAASRFVAASGVVSDESTETSPTGHVELGVCSLTRGGVVRGGLYATIVEAAGSVAASRAVLERGQSAVGVNNSPDFRRPSTGGRAVVEATVLHQGRTQQLWQVIITDEALWKVLARGQLRLQNVPLPQSGE